MSSLPRFQDKIDVLDMIISILKDHEENLSSIVDKLDTFVEDLSSLNKKFAKIDQILQRSKFVPMHDPNILTVECQKWPEFREMSIGASLVAFEIDETNLSISSASRGFVFSYSERLPDLESLTSDNSEDLSLRRVVNLDPFSVKAWLSEELKITEDKILEGRLRPT